MRLDDLRRYLRERPDPPPTARQKVDEERVKAVRERFRRAAQKAKAQRGQARGTASNMKAVRRAERAWENVDGTRYGPDPQGQPRGKPSRIPINHPGYREGDPRLTSPPPNRPRPRYQGPGPGGASMDMRRVPPPPQIPPGYMPPGMRGPDTGRPPVSRPDTLFEDMSVSPYPTTSAPPPMGATGPMADTLGGPPAAMPRWAPPDPMQGNFPPFEPAMPAGQPSYTNWLQQMLRGR